ncbi:MAG: hypothetical protein IIC67_06400, partial [Thaumarchaeota archaeon]|nr:hypothetical protein [Nitrososphaerota archaeon]
MADIGDIPDIMRRKKLSLQIDEHTINITRFELRIMELNQEIKKQGFEIEVNQEQIIKLNE